MTEPPRPEGHAYHPPAELSVDAGSADTLGRKVYLMLHEEIAKGRVLPGSRLTLRGMATAFDISIQPVREAINMLIAEDVLELAGNRIVRMPQLNQQSLNELWSVRVLVEGDVAYRFANNATEADLQRLEDASKAMIEALLADTIDVEHLMSTIYGSAVSFIDGCGNTLLAGIARNLRLRSAAHIAEALSMPVPLDSGFIKFTTEISRETTFAARARDAERMRHLRCVDIRTFQRMIYERLGWSLTQPLPAWMTAQPGEP